MSNSNQNIIYTAADIEKYLAGKLTPQQMHAMEKAALDDPFLAEAIEGFEGMKGKIWENQLLVLKTHFAEQGQVAKVIPLHKAKNTWWKSVAAILIIGAGALLTFVLTRDSNTEEKAGPQIAQIVSAADDTVTVATKPASVTASVNPTASQTAEDLAKETGPVKKAAADETLSNVNTNQPVVDVVTIAEPPPGINQSKSDNKSAHVASTEEKNKLFAAEEMSRSKKNEILKPGVITDDVNDQKQKVFGNVRKEQSLNNYFTAQVVGPDNLPLPFTNISIKKENFGTYADAKGMVRLVSTDSILNIEVKSVGYQPKTFALYNNKPQTKIILQEDGYADIDKKADGKSTTASTQKIRAVRLLSDSVINVEPADGWENYNTYVANNLEIPDNYNSSNIGGEVELTFDVKPNGTISNLKIRKSLGAEYDEAAKRLILEGPQWKVKKGKSAKKGVITSAKVKLQF